MHSEYIDTIIMSEDDNKMHELRDVLESIITYIEEKDQNTYNKIECDLYEIAIGKKLDREKAENWVYNMKPKAKWNYNSIEKLKAQYKFNVPTVSAYAILNMLYSDFSNILGEEMTEETIKKYIKAMEDWYYDPDLKHTEDEKLYYYYKYIAN